VLKIGILLTVQQLFLEMTMGGNDYNELSENVEELRSGYCWDYLHKCENNNIGEKFV
jgi:hypothetical protein